MPPLLRFTQTKLDDDQFRVEVALEGTGEPRQTATTDIEFRMGPQDHEDLRWYLEDYLQYPHDPAPTVAARVEARMQEIGVELFRAVFQASDDARDLWATLRKHLNDTRVEVSTSVQEAASIPWELTRDPKTDVPLALRSPAFVRVQSQTAQTPKLPKLEQDEDAVVRILLVICRPKRDDDVPFRSVASKLIKGLGDQAQAHFELTVLRPATFDSLSRTLHNAKASGKPFHIVHFDGHGMYADIAKSAGLSGILKGLTALLLSGQREGSHGYLLFEDPDTDQNLQLVDGPALGKLLVDTDVSVLVLNACRSAHADLQQAPEENPAQSDDPHGKIRAFGSLAQEVMDAGVAGVVAMRYNVYVVTAAQFVADLYAALAQGQTLGQAVTQGRKQLHAKPSRSIAFDPIPLQDWPVPIVYEAAPIRLFPEAKHEARLHIELDLPETRQADAAKSAPKAGLDPGLPKRPDAGFFGRDETLLALDRAFDTQPIVLLHALAGSGKTATAAEFARWYAGTGGLHGGPVLFTSFEHHTPLRSVLGHFGQVFGPMLERVGVNWSAITETEDMRQVALHVLKQVPVLWIWDNVEPVPGFPRGTPSEWSDAEQQELVDFLRDARETKARFLLTSRRTEDDWLGDLPMRVAVPPMPMQERVQLARALAEKREHRLTDVDDWRPLLRFTGGNPLTISVVVGQALRDGLTSRAQIKTFVTRLRQGKEDLAGDKDQGRSASLGASLSYGFDKGFTEQDRKRLALLHLFQGFVDVDVIKLMGDPGAGHCLPEVKGLTREDGIALLDKAADIGLLTAHGGGYYAIHPALPWFFKSLFDTHYPTDHSPFTTHHSPATDHRLPITGPPSPLRAFVEAMGALGNYYHSQYQDGNRDVIAALTAEEANLLHARRLARENGWYHRVTSAMQGLRQLYGQTGRRADWRRLVEEIVPDFVDPATDGPLPGREDDWGLVTEYRVRLAQEDRDWPEAERLQRVCVDWDRQRAAEELAKPVEDLTDAERNTVRTLCVSLSDLGHTLREQGKPECVRAYKEDYDLSLRIDDRPGAAATAFNLGHVYTGGETGQTSSLRDLDQAEQWYRHSLELRDEHDRLGRSKCLGQLGAVARERFKDARAADRPEKELLRLLNDAAGLYRQALELLPDTAVLDLAVAHGQLGNTYGDAGDLDRALPHYRASIQYEERQGNVYAAGQTRFNVACDLANAGRLVDAREYALAALRNFESYGNRAAAEIARTQRLLAQIEEAIKKQQK